MFYTCATESMLSMFVQNLDMKRVDISVCWFEAEETLSYFPYLSVGRWCWWCAGVRCFIQHWTTKEDDTPTEELGLEFPSLVYF